MDSGASKAAWTAVIAVVMLLSTTIPSYAGTAYSSYSNFTCGSYDYKNRAWVTTDGSGAYATTMVYSGDGSYMPAGWYGYLARLYNDAGVLKDQVGYVYSSNSTYAFGGTTTIGKVTVRDSYYSYGVSKSWYGSGYHGHATWKSPLQTF